MITSPVTCSPNVVLCRQFESRTLIAEYRRQLAIDVSAYFRSVESVSIFECQDSGYKFYHPAGIIADGAFYEALQSHWWYYQPWKWEHEAGSRWIRPTDRVLEIGCGTGDFIQRISNRTGASCVGLELSSRAATEAKARGLEVHNTTLERHSADAREEYDLVCAFQVLEHIQDVGQFMNNVLRVVKKSGKFIVGVPNNDSYIKYIEWDVLNMPPHHQGLWNKRSLALAGRLLGWKVERILVEPLSPERLYVSKYVRAQLERKILGPALRRIPVWRLEQVASVLHRRILGETILAVYSKAG